MIFETSGCRVLLQTSGCACVDTRQSVSCVLQAVVGSSNALFDALTANRSVRKTDRNGDTELGQALAEVPARRAHFEEGVPDVWMHFRATRQTVKTSWRCVCVTLVCKVGQDGVSASQT
jgi:hypothetical protein